MTSTILPPGAVYALTDIRAHDVTYPGYHQVLVPAYVARPAAPGRHPGLIVVHGIHGHEEHMKDVARRFAIHGYVALLPALYCREEFLAVVEEEDLQKAAVWLRERPNAQTISDLAGALTFLQTAPYVSERIGLVGFCSRSCATRTLAMRSSPTPVPAIVPRWPIWPGAAAWSGCPAT